MEPNPYHATAATSKAVRTQRRGLPAIAWFVAGYYPLAIVMGLTEVSGGDRALKEVAIVVLLQICLGMWAIADARERGKPIPYSQRKWFLLAAQLVVPGYVIVTRGWKGLGWVVLHTIAWPIVGIGVALLVSQLRYSPM